MAPNPYELVIRKCKQYEDYLAKEFQAHGNGLGQKAHDVRDRLDRRVFDTLLFVASTRNKLVHDMGFSRKLDLRAYVAACEFIDQNLKRKPSAFARMTRKFKTIVAGRR